MLDINTLPNIDALIKIHMILSLYEEVEPTPEHGPDAIALNVITIPRIGRRISPELLIALNDHIRRQHLWLSTSCAKIVEDDLVVTLVDFIPF